MRELMRTVRRSALASGLALLTTLAPAAFAQETATPEATTALLDWSREIWTAAQTGKSAPAIDLLERLPPQTEEAGVGDLALAVERYKGNIAKRESDRAQRIEEVKADLEKHADENELLKALKSAIEWHTLATDKSEVLHSPKVQLLVDQAVSDAKAAEEKGAWLDAHALYNHLNVLFEEQRTYEADLRRLSQRLLMLRLYTPERLYQMRNVQRLAEGEEALPPYNKIGEDWHEKLAGITEQMLTRSMGNASVSHVDRVPMSKMLVGAYRAVRTMATTDDLSDAFPGLADAPARETFVRFTDERIAAIQEKPNEEWDYGDLIESYKALRNLNSATVKIAPEALIHEFTNGGFGELDDFSAVIWPDEMEQFSRTTEGTFKGVGVQITLNEALEIKVVTPLEGTPAARAGIRAGDLIRKVDGDSTLGMSLNQAVERITGPAGTPVTVTIEREGVEEPIDFTLTRAEIPIYSVKGWRRVGAKETQWDWYVDRPNQIGYARITQFNTNTTQEMRAALNSMTESGLKGLILDMRGNPGGLLSEAVGISSLFIPDGIIVTQEDNQGAVREKQTAVKGPRIPEIPVVVLINGGSASASEIVAGALQDYRKAVLVGDRSFGKGSVQNVFVLGPKAAFKLTTQYYRLPGREGQPGRLIHKRPDSTQWGIDPDVEVEVLPKQFGEAFQLRQDADIVEFDDAGNLVENADRPDPSRLITEGLDPQLETGLLLIQSQVVPAMIGARAEAR